MINLNHDITRASKKDAFAIIAEMMTDRGFNGQCTITIEKAERLYKYFMPAAPAKPKTAWQWVAKAVGDRDLREQLNYLHSDGDNLYGTDGHRIHWAPTTLPAGYYCPKTCEPVKLDIVYPAVKRVIDTRRANRGLFAIADLPVVSDTVNGKPVAKVNIADDVYVSQAFLLQAMAGAGHSAIAYGDKRTNMQGVGTFGDWVIMPIIDR